MDGNSSADNSVGNQSTPPAGGSKTAVKVVVIEIIIVIFLIGFIFGVLGFLKIIPLGSFLPSSITSISEKITPKNYDVTASSQIAGYGVRIEDKKSLVDLLRSWNTFGKNYSSTLDGNTQNQPVEKVAVLLTSSEQSGTSGVIYKNTDGTTYLSSNLKISPKTLSVYIFISKEILNDSSKNLGAYINTAFISTLYKQTHDIQLNKTNIDKRDKEITDLLKNLYSKNKVFFKVVKK